MPPSRLRGTPPRNRKLGAAEAGSATGAFEKRPGAARVAQFPATVGVSATGYGHPWDRLVVENGRLRDPRRGLIDAAVFRDSAVAQPVSESTSRNEADLPSFAISASRDCGSGSARKVERCRHGNGRPEGRPFCAVDRLWAADRPLSRSGGDPQFGVAVGPFDDDRRVVSRTPQPTTGPRGRQPQKAPAYDQVPPVRVPQALSPVFAL